MAFQRKPGTLSNGTLSLKFMQRGLAENQKPVEAEKAEIDDESKWVVVSRSENDMRHSPAILEKERA